MLIRIYLLCNSVQYLYLSELCLLRGPEKAFCFSRPFKWRLKLDVPAKGGEQAELQKFPSDNLTKRIIVKASDFDIQIQIPEKYLIIQFPSAFFSMKMLLPKFIGCWVFIK